MLGTSAYAAPILHTTDFIANANRTNFVDFEPIGNTTTFGASFTQDGVSVNQVRSGRDIGQFYAKLAELGFKFKT